MQCVPSQAIERTAQRTDCPALSSDVVVWPDHQVMVGRRVMLVVLGEIVQSSFLPAVVIARRRQNRDRDGGEFVPIWAHRLPVRIVGGMREPLVEDRIRN